MNIILKKRNNTDGFYVFFNKQKGICISDIKNGVISDYKSVSPNAAPDFDAVIDKNDVVHILYHDLQHNLYHAVFAGNGWDISVILKAKQGGLSNSSMADLKLLYTGGMLCAFYVITYKEQQLLSCQIIEPAGALPEVVDVLQNDADYYIASDLSHNICVYYHSGRNNHAFGLIQYKYNEKEWGEFKEISPEKTVQIKNPFAIYGFQNHAHLVYVKDNVITYMKQHKIEIPLSRLQDSFSAPVISIRYDRIFVMWQSGTHVLGMMSDNNGHSFTRLSEIMAARSGGILLFKLRAANTDALNIIDLCYGKIQNRRFHLAAIQNYFSPLSRALSGMSEDSASLASTEETMPLKHEDDDTTVTRKDTLHEDYLLTKEIEEQKKKIMEQLNIETLSNKVDLLAPTMTPSSEIKSFSSSPKKSEGQTTVSKSVHEGERIKQISNEKILEKLEQLDRKISRLLKKL